jgi:hypothetical protein
MKTKSTTTGPKDFPGSFHARYHLKILKALVITTNLFVLFMYASVFFIFADMPFDAKEELKVIGNSMAWATGFGVGFSFLIFAGDGLIYITRNRKRVKYPTVTKSTTVTVSHNYPVPRPLIIKGPTSAMVNPEFSNN